MYFPEIRKIETAKTVAEAMRPHDEAIFDLMVNSRENSPDGSIGFGTFAVTRGVFLLAMGQAYHALVQGGAPQSEIEELFRFDQRGIEIDALAFESARSGKKFTEIKAERGI